MVYKNNVFQYESMTSFFIYIVKILPNFILMRRIDLCFYVMFFMPSFCYKRLNVNGFIGCRDYIHVLIFLMSKNPFFFSDLILVSIISKYNIKRVYICDVYWTCIYS